MALIATSALTTVGVARAGHIGAKATWSELPATAGGDHGGDGGD